ncbi:MAG: OmpP1/FadL family transporter, partial [Polyangiales bacterium]
GMVPIGDFTRASSFHVDELEQLFTNRLYAELYEDRLEATSLALALASQVHEKLSIGVATTLNLTNRAHAPVFVPDAGNLADIELLSDVRVDVGVAPHLGVNFEPTDDLDFSLTAHSPTRFEIIADYEFTLRDGSVDSSSAKFTHAYTPWKLALGGAWDVYERPDHTVQLAGTLEYTLWSNYIDRVSNRPLPGYSWNDTASGALGVRWRYGKLHTYADLLFQPSPVPDQRGRTNYVDNDRIGALLGAEGEIELFGTDFRAGAQLQLHRLLPRSTRKGIPPQDGSADHLVRDALPDDAVDGSTRTPIEGREGLQTNNPGFPGFDSDGWLVGATANLSVLF